ncbi:hypothetical protein SAMN05421833_105244 [Microbispora rosea]|uniref:Uncharacterized protein n=1 Tax=Microbispora rosea TaxID=58117 RepID=A0A1N6XQC6_9ACTN|nr:hypothetical protein SAMN05421833_105244 [Microbispora rosea]
MTENGVIPWSAQQAVELGDRLRTALSVVGDDR